MKKTYLTKSLTLSLLILLFMTLPLLSGAGAGDNPKLQNRSHSIPTISKKIKVDGVLNEPAWQDALKLELKYEVDPGENIPAPVKTEVYLYSSGTHLYVGFHAYDPDPSQIRARLTDRDNIGHDDYVGIILDTFNDPRNAFGFYVNPYGVQSDRIVISLGNEQSEWDAIWGSAAKIGKDGYVVEISIPFHSLRFQGKNGEQSWRFDIVRNYPRNLLHVLALFPRDRSDNCYMCQADKMVGFDGAKPGKNIEFDPTLSGFLTQERDGFPDGDFVKTNDELEAGLTARWSFTPNMTLSATVNPDFSQVEADAAQLDINTPFALFYPEKRPFFLEGDSIFLGPFYAVYTRTIRDPEWGIKLTGKEGRHGLGIFSVKDSVTNLLFPSSESSGMTSLAQSNMSSALRYRYDLGKSSIVGGFVTDREGEGYFNRMAGIDGDIKFTKSDRLVFQILGSRTRYPDEVVNDFNQPEGEFGGSALALYYQHATQHVVLFGQYYEITADFRADVGFVGQSDVRVGQAGGSYIWRRNPGHWFTVLSAGGTYTYEADRSGKVLQKVFSGTLDYYGPLQSYVNFTFNTGRRSFLGAEFDSNNVSMRAQLRPSGKLFMGVAAAFGDQIDYANIQDGDRFMVNPFLQYNIGRHLYVGLDHVYEKLDVAGGHLYTANLSNLRLVYQFSRRSFLRTILQYADYKYNPDNYTFPTEPRFKHLFSQILFSYKINPQTVLFLGYSDDYYGYRYVPITQNNRTFFLKIGYALVL